MTQRLIAEFTENYLETLFYFCLKKTGSRDEAEDLASDIALNMKSSKYFVQTVIAFFFASKLVL